MLLSLVKRESMLELCPCATSASFTMIGRALQIQKMCTCFECEIQGPYKYDFLKLKNKNDGNTTWNGKARRRAYALGGGEPNLDSNVVTDNSYDVKLAKGRITRVNNIIQGCTFNLLNHPFNIDLMPVELGSFDAIIGMDWLSMYRTMIVCDEKIVRIPYGDEVLIVKGDKSDGRNEFRLNIISCTKTQKYFKKGCHVFLARITKKKTEDKSEEKRPKDVLVIEDFLEDEKEHEEHLRQILKLLKKEELYAKFSKYEFWIPRVQFLDHVIDSQSIHVDPAKIESVKDWASPNSPTEIRQFLGLSGYYRRFIEGFSKVARPMTKLTQSKVKFEWGDKQEAAFQLLKQKLCSAPI
nr:putative reverse transcriptase domain-containing protein [Tanacetum cinerariifolium]